MADTIYSIPTIATYLIIAEADIKVLQVTIQTRMTLSRAHTSAKV